MISLSVIHPSRGRPKKAFETFQRWVERCHYGSFEYILSVDENDPTLSEYQSVFLGYDIDINDNRSVVNATNFAAQRSDGEWLVYLSDDFECPDKWDLLLENELHRVTRPTLLKVDDCLQPFHVKVVTIPIMNRALYNRLGYFWYPEYKSMFCDEDLYHTARKLEALRMAPHLKFPHNHYSIGKAEHDQTYKQSEANWNQGKEVFARRKAENFPL